MHPLRKTRQIFCKRFVTVRRYAIRFDPSKHSRSEEPVNTLPAL
jgi:hypothetical protein